MAVVSFDPLEYAKELEATGMPRQQAEVIARGVTQMFIHNFDALVTKDYLDARLDEQAARIDSLRGTMNTRFQQVDARFGQIDARFEQVDARFEQFEARIDGRFEDFEARMDARFGQFTAEFDGRLGKLQVMMAIVMAGVAVPVIQSMIAGLS